MLKSLVISMALPVVFSACSSHPVLPEKSDIKVSRETPSDKCKNLGPIEGRSLKVNAKPEESLEDMKSEAIRKGANYVRIETMGAQSSTIRGTAYFCD